MEKIKKMKVNKIKVNKIKVPAKTLHQVLMEEFDECIPISQYSDSTEIIHYKKERLFHVNGHGIFKNVEEYAVMPRSLVLDAPRDTGSESNQVSDYVLYLKR